MMLKPNRLYFDCTLMMLKPNGVFVLLKKMHPRSDIGFHSADSFKSYKTGKLNFLVQTELNAEMVF